MADRTHSHDTSTPAMSDETVPSEEFVLVPREPTPAMQRAYFDSIDTNMHRVENDVRFGRYENMRTAYRAMIAAAPTLSASHLAKEGGEAGAVEPIEKHRIANRLRGMFDMSVSSEGDFNRLTPAGFRLLRQAHDALIAPDEAVAAPAPTPSPAAKSGDAVREIAADLERSAGKPLVEGSWGGLALEPVARAIAQDRGALSTPTEGPVSQTEGMGGDAS